MADLSQYVDFSVVLDKSGTTPVIRLTDTSVYPDGVAATVTGVFTAVQPDGIAVTGSFTAPDIAWDGEALTVASKELRLASDSTLQKGNYTFTYIVKATGYEDTVKTQTIKLDYTPVLLDIQDLTSVFTPSIRVIDATLYAIAGYSVAVQRAWNADISYVNQSKPSVTSTNAVFDMVYGGSYYDAHYAIDFAAIVTYTSSTAVWFSFKDMLLQALQADVYTPPSITALAASLNTMQQQIASGTYCGGCGCNDEEPFEQATALYTTFVENGRNSLNLSQLAAYVEQLQKIFNCSGVLNRTHTNAPMSAYDWGNATGGGTRHAPVQFTVGSGKDHAPNDGDSEYINSDLDGFIPDLIYLSSIADFLASSEWQPRSGGGFILLNRTFTDGEQFTQTFANNGTPSSGQFTTDEVAKLRAILSVNN